MLYIQGRSYALYLSLQISFSIMSSRSIHVVTNGRICTQLSQMTGCAHTHNFLYSSAEGQLGCFHDLAIENNTVMNMRLQITFSFLLRYLFILDILRSETDGSYSNYIFNCLRKFHTVPVCIPANRLHPLQHFLSLDFLITASLSGVR